MDDFVRLKHVMGCLYSTRESESIRKRLKELPKYDMKPVVRGKWKWSDDFFETFVCSECGYDTEDRIKQNFCPNCGAEMS